MSDVIKNGVIAREKYLPVVKKLLDEMVNNSLHTTDGSLINSFCMI